MTDPAVATFSGPELTGRVRERVTVAKLFEQLLSYKLQMRIGASSCQLFCILTRWLIVLVDVYEF